MTIVNCRSMLWSQLNVLSDRVANLHRAAAATTWAIVDLADATQVCEDVRRASLHALADQYQRIVAGRPIPKSLGVARPRLRSNPSAQSDESLRPAAPNQIAHTLTPPKHQMRYQISQIHRPQSQVIQRKPPPQRQYSLRRYQQPSPPTDNDEQMSADYNNDALHIHNEPPSPPLTPKTSDNRSDSSVSTTSTRPANSVFAQFCAEAMSLQVDTKRPVPGDPHCACGYEWHVGRRDAVPLKEGFRLTHRYLAKSHVGPQGFGCVLCTSTGRSGRFESVEELREHVDASHTKWQLLHDQDCRASSKLADGFW